MVNLEGEISQRMLCKPTFFFFTSGELVYLVLQKSRKNLSHRAMLHSGCMPIAGHVHSCSILLLHMLSSAHIAVPGEVVSSFLLSFSFFFVEDSGSRNTSKEGITL
jgi:hypothetical protein